MPNHNFFAVSIEVNAQRVPNSKKAELATRCANKKRAGRPDSQAASTRKT
jgi:hypothetical protein